MSSPVPNENSGEFPKALEATWGTGEDLEPIYADNLHLSRINDQYYLTFGQLRVPVGLDSADIKGEIKPVARLILGESAMKKIAELLRRSVVEEKKE